MSLRSRMVRRPAAGSIGDGREVRGGECRPGRGRGSFPGRLGPAPGQVRLSAKAQDLPAGLVAQLQGQ